MAKEEINEITYVWRVQAEHKPDEADPVFSIYRRTQTLVNGQKVGEIDLPEVQKRRSEFKSLDDLFKA
jgi:hypothetical protein